MLVLKIGNNVIPTKYNIAIRLGSSDNYFPVCHDRLFNPMTLNLTPHQTTKIPIYNRIDNILNVGHIDEIRM